MNTRLLLPLLACCCPLGLSSCGEEEGVVTPELQPISAPRYAYKVDAAASERFPLHADTSKRFRYVPGSSWAELNPTRFRSLNFAFGPDGVGECYVSEIASFVDGGLENVNRWRGQMGLKPLSPAALAELPRATFAGQDSVFVKIDGSFQGMGQADSQADFRLMGMLINQGCEAFSVKMTGPRWLLEQQESEFLAFCETLTVVADPQRPPYAQMKVGPFEFLRPCEWEYMVPESDERVKRPLGFAVGPEKQGRVELGIVFEDAGVSSAEMINGWLRERGAEALSDEAVAALPDQVLLNSPGKWVETRWEGRRFVGVVSQLQAEGHAPMTVVATFEGPESLVGQEEVMFRTFAESLRLGPVGAVDPAASPH